MENLSSHSQESKLELNQLAIKNIEDSAKWGKFIAIVGFVLVALLLFIALIMAFVLPSINFSELQDMQGMQNNPGAAMLANGMGPFLSFLYLIIAVLYFIPILFLYNYSTQSLKAIKNVDSDLLTSAFNNMRKQYKFVGIMTIIVIALYALLFIGGFIAGIMSAFL